MTSLLIFAFSLPMHTHRLITSKKNDLFLKLDENRWGENVNFFLYTYTHTHTHITHTVYYINIAKTSHTHCTNQQKRNHMTQIAGDTAQTMTSSPHQHPSHLDVVGVSDQLVNVGRLSAQLRHIVLQDDAFTGAAVQAVGQLFSCCTWMSHIQTHRFDLVLEAPHKTNHLKPVTPSENTR